MSIFILSEGRIHYLRSLFVFGRGSKKTLYQIHPIRKLYLIFVNLTAPHYLWRIAGDPFTFLFRVMYYYFCNVTYIILVLFYQNTKQKKIVMNLKVFVYATNGLKCLIKLLSTNK